MPASIHNYSSSAQNISIGAMSPFRGHSIEDRRPATASVILTYVDEKPNLNNKIMHLLDECTYLKDNWDEDGAKAPIGSVISIAKGITTLLSKHGQPIFHIAPGSNGEVMLDIRNKNKTKSVEILLYQDKAVAVLFPEQGTASD